LKLRLKKIDAGLVPADSETYEELKKVKNFAVVHGNFRRQRNVRFHRKWFALLKMAFDQFEPEITDEHPQWGEPQTNFERFRKDIIILTGRYTRVVRLDGSVALEAASVSFANMGDDEFQKLYSESIDVIIKHVMNGTSPDEIDDTVNKILQFI